MDVSEDSTSDGVVGAIPTTQYVAIQFPGYVRNVARATHMLGGTESIAAALNSTGQSSFLKLSFRPEDQSSHPLFGDHHATRGLVLKISRKLRKPGQPDDSDASAPKMQVVAQVSSGYRFMGLADYQYLPMDPGGPLRYQPHAQAQNGLPLPIPPENFADSAEPSGSWEPLLIAPPVFAKSDVPIDYAFRQFKYQPPGAKGASRALVQVVGFYIPSVPGLIREEEEQAHAVPPASAAPHDNAVANAPAAATGITQAGVEAAAPPKETAMAVLQRQLLELLEQRPVWSRQLLKERLGASIDAAEAEAVAAPAPAAAVGTGAAATIAAAPAVATAHDVSAAAAGPSGTSSGAAPVASTSGSAAMAPGPTGAAAAAAAAASAQLSSPLQVLLARHTYRFKTGPWCHLYIRRGYDPRQYADSRKYQLLVYRLPASWYQYLAAQAADSLAAGGVTTGQTVQGEAAAVPPQQQQQQQEQATHMDKLHSFSELPTSSVTEFQLCDLDDPTVKTLLATCAASDRCTEADGWFTKAAMMQLQSTVEARFQSLIDKLDEAARLAKPAQQQQAPPAKKGRKGKKAAAAEAAAAAAATGTGGTAPDSTADATQTGIVASGAAAAAAGASAERPMPAASPNASAGAAPSAAPLGATGAAMADSSNLSGLLPPSYLSALMEQMALQPGTQPAAQDDDEYEILDASGNDEEDEDDGPAAAGFAAPQDWHAQLTTLPAGRESAPAGAGAAATSRQFPRPGQTPPQQGGEDMELEEGEEEGEEDGDYDVDMGHEHEFDDDGDEQFYM